ncbi:MAG: DinB family protein [Chloroflexota bacterium]
MNKAIERLARQGEEWRRAVAAIPDPRVELESGDWNPHQLLAHTRDTNAHVYLLRLQRIVLEDNPLFGNFDADTWMAARYDPDEPLDTILEELVGQCDAAAAWLNGLADAVWARPGTHVTIGTLPFAGWLERMLAHIQEHLDQLKR